MVNGHHYDARDAFLEVRLKRDEIKIEDVLSKLKQPMYFSNKTKGTIKKNHKIIVAFSRLRWRHT